jgi:hypothetical protein
MFLADNWLWMVLPVAVCGMLAIFIDVRFIIVAMMILFVILPMLLSLLYFYYGLSPEARWSIMEKTATVDDSGITLDFADERMKKHVILREDVHNIIEKNDALIIMLRGKRYTSLMIPASAINPDVTQGLRQLITQTH